MDHVIDLHFEAQCHPMVGGEFAVFSPIRDETLLPLPLKCIKEFVFVGIDDPIWRAISLAAFGEPRNHH